MFLKLKQNKSYLFLNTHSWQDKRTGPTNDDNVYVQNKNLMLIKVNANKIL